MGRGRAGQGRTGQDRAGQGRTEQSRTGQFPTVIQIYIHTYIHTHIHTYTYIEKCIISLRPGWLISLGSPSSRGLFKGRASPSHILSAKVHYEYYYQKTRNIIIIIIIIFIIIVFLCVLLRYRLYVHVYRY